MKDSSGPPSKPNAAADFWRQAGVDQAAFGVTEHHQGFHSQQSVDVDSRIALPASLPPLLPRTLPPTGPEDEPTDAPEAYATGEFSFPDTEDDEMAFLTPPTLPSEADLAPLDELFERPLVSRQAPTSADAVVEPVASQSVGAAPQGPAVARRIWRGRIDRKTD